MIDLKQDIVIKQMKEINSSLSLITESAGRGIDMAFEQMRERLGADGFVKWKDLTDRMVRAQFENNQPVIESLTKDLSELFDKTT